MKNIYFLVEGKRTERKIYPQWLNTLLPNHTRVTHAQDANALHYYLISGDGYPQILKRLDDAIAEVNEIGKFEFLVFVIDSDNLDAPEMEQEVLRAAKPSLAKLAGGCTFKVIVQHRTMETWLLGNPKVIPRNPAHPRLKEMVSAYNVADNDPEAMPLIAGYDHHPTLHHDYLRWSISEKGVATYTKELPNAALDLAYLQAIQDRVAQTNHLPSLQTLFDFCRRMA